MISPPAVLDNSSDTGAPGNRPTVLNVTVAILPAAATVPAARNTSAPKTKSTAKLLNWVSAAKMVSVFHLRKPPALPGDWQHLIVP